MDLEEATKRAVIAARPYLKTLHDSLPLKVLTGYKPPYTEEASYADDYYLEAITDVPQGPVFYKLVVFDMDGTRAEHLRIATAFAHNGRVFTRKADEPPVHVGPSWEFRLQPTGVKI